MFGDFGQELFALASWKQGRNSHIGNDWISYIRELEGIKYSKKNRHNGKNWFCGFLGNVTFNIVFPEIIASRSKVKQREEQG